ncbi:MAG: hypothetical protein EXQ58_04010 [Acidobacteria bacterium]|nr:hypothetical protein [Acidobacteriota bacterium]
MLYAKPEKDGDAVRVTGEFVGRMTGVTNWDDAIPILFKKLEGTYQQFRRTVLSKLVEAPALGPFGFKIPISDELVDRKLKLHVLPATTDSSSM